MKKKYLIISLIALTVVGAIFTALSSNMLFDDLFNKSVKFADATLFVSIPAVMFTLLFVLGIFYVLRCYQHKDCVKRISKHYLILAAVFGAIGAFFSIFGNLKCYGTLFGRHPFPGYSIIFLVLNLAMLGGAIFGLLKVKGLKDDEGRVQIKVGYVFKTIGWFLFVCLMLNRLGMFLAAPIYIYWRNLYQTFPFYIYLLMPVLLGVLEALYILKLINKKPLFMLTIAGLAVNAALFAYIIIMGINDTAFISSLSQAMPLERMASMPIEILIHVLSYAGVSAAILVENKKHKEAQPAE